VHPGHERQHGSGSAVCGQHSAESVSIGNSEGPAVVGRSTGIRATTSTYSANFAAFPGHFTLTSHSGANAWYGSPYDYFGNSTMDAHKLFNNTAGLPNQPERQNDFGGTMGRPIRKDKNILLRLVEGLRFATPTAA
jgi:hypothetical protein